MARPQHGTQARGRTDRTGLRSALWLPIFDARADPVVVARLAAEGEEAGWHGVFVWDHLRWRAPVRQVADPGITLAAIAAAHQLRLGPWSRPWPPPAGQGGQGDRDPGPAQRRPLTLGVGLGSDRFASELSKTGEQLDDRCAARCWTRRWRSAPPPGPARRCSGPACRCGPPGSLGHGVGGLCARRAPQRPRGEPEP